jgi:hypothetical protein
MHRRSFLALGTIVVFTTFQGFTAYAKKKTADQTAQFFASLSKDQKILQALNRLTFGPRTPKRKPPIRPRSSSRRFPKTRRSSRR